jgi:hypothetical protein
MVKKRGGADVYTFRFTSLYPLPTLAKKLNAALLFWVKSPGQNASLLPQLYFKKQVFEDGKRN